MNIEHFECTFDAHDIHTQRKTIRYRQAGTGLPLVLLHAFPLDSALWQPQLSALSAHYRVIAPDLRGMGGSGPVDARPVSMDEMADDILLLIDQLGLQHVVLGGLSIGGYVALSFVLRFPERVSALILSNTRAGPDTAHGRAAREAMAQAVARNGPQAVIDLSGEKPYGPECPTEVKEFVRAITRRQSRAGLIAAIHGMAQRPDRTPALPSILAPTLIIGGAHDTLIPSAEGLAMQHLISGSRFVDIPHAGHMSNIEQPEAFNQAIDAFLGGLEGCPVGGP